MPRHTGQLAADGIGATTRGSHFQDILAPGGRAGQAAVVQGPAGGEQGGLIGGQHIDTRHERKPCRSYASRHPDVNAVVTLGQHGSLGACETAAIVVHRSSDTASIGERLVTHAHRVAHPQIAAVV